MLLGGWGHPQGLNMESLPFPCYLRQSIAFTCASFSCLESRKLWLFLANRCGKIPNSCVRGMEAGYRFLFSLCFKRQEKQNLICRRLGSVLWLFQCHFCHFCPAGTMPSAASPWCTGTRWRRCASRWCWEAAGSSQPSFPSSLSCKAGIALASLIWWVAKEGQSNVLGVL